MPLHRRKGYVFLVLLALFPCSSDAVNFSQCLIAVTNCALYPDDWNCTLNFNISNTTAVSILRTSDGYNVSTGSDILDTATSLSYYGCHTYCGEEDEQFNWTVFSQEYSAWLLPYLALLSQLPFGARRRTDNLMSAILTLGSPTLAGYSLYITLLNSRWLNDQLFSGIDYPSVAVRQSVVRVLSSLQQVPLRIHPGESARFESLVVHPDNDAWWLTLAEELDYSHTWSISSATSITWVVVAYLLTVADSLSNVADNINSNGMGTGSVWLWLLPIVVGWLVLSPKCDYDRVHDAFDKANRQVFVADSRDPDAPPTVVTSNFGMTIRPSPRWKLFGSNISSPDESRMPPVFNYARTLSWSRTAYMTSLFYQAAWMKSNDRVGVNGEPIPGNVGSDVPRESRLGNGDQIIGYCQPNHHQWPSSYVLWPRGVFFNMVVASLMSLQLQWGTTMSGFLVALSTPTTGLGCRSFAYLLYGILSTLVWIVLVLSSALGYYADHLNDLASCPGNEGQCTTSTFSGPQEPTKAFHIKGDRPASGSSRDVAIPLQEIQVLEVTEAEEGMNYLSSSTDIDQSASITTAMRNYARRIHALADMLRWTGKSLAILNAVGIIANSVFQYAGVYDNCYCDSSVLGWGKSRAFNVINPHQSDLNLATNVWKGALALALTSCAFFVGTIYLARDSLPS